MMNFRNYLMLENGAGWFMPNEALLLVMNVFLSTGSVFFKLIMNYELDLVGWVGIHFSAYSFHPFPFMVVSIATYYLQAYTYVATCITF